MKEIQILLLLLLFASTFLFSCSRDQDQNQNLNSNSDEYFMKYKANGQLVEHKGGRYQGVTVGVQAQRATITGVGNFYKVMIINGQTGVSSFLQFTINADSVQSGQTYTLLASNSNFLQAVVDGKNYNLTPPYLQTPNPYNGSVKITDHSNGMISGTFSGKMGRTTSTTSPFTFEDVTITEGSFKTNVVY